MELLAQGRLAEVFAYGEGRVVKLDRPDWSGVSAFEADVLLRLADAGLPVARSHGVVTIDERCGVILDRVEGRSLLWELMDSPIDAVDPLAKRFAALQRSIGRTTIGGSPDLVGRLRGELEQGGLSGGLSAGLSRELIGVLADLDDGQRGVCHFDFHPDNVLVSPHEWVVIDWLTVASGPPVADLARTLLIWGQRSDPPILEFMRRVRRHGLAHLEVDDDVCDAWVGVEAGARLAEGFDADYSGWLRRVAEGTVGLFG
jgi:hypothetical protein